MTRQTSYRLAFPASLVWLVLVGRYRGEAWGAILLSLVFVATYPFVWRWTVRHHFEKQLLIAMVAVTLLVFGGVTLWMATLP